MTSTNSALAATGYTTTPSPSYGLKRVLRDGVEVGHFDCQTAWDLPGMREYAARLSDPNVQRQTAELQRLFDTHRARLAAEAVRAEPQASQDEICAEIAMRIEAQAA